MWTNNNMKNGTSLAWAKAGDMKLLYSTFRVRNMRPRSGDLPCVVAHLDPGAPGAVGLRVLFPKLLCEQGQFFLLQCVHCHAVPFSGH